MRTPVDPTDIYVGSRLQTRRVAMGLSQSDLAKRAGITFQQVQKYERGKNRISASRLQEFSQALQVPASFFFDGGPNSHDPPSDSLPTPNSIYEFLATRDGRMLIDSFIAIQNKTLRRSIVALIEQLATNGL